MFVGSASSAFSRLSGLDFPAMVLRTGKRAERPRGESGSSVFVFEHSVSLAACRICISWIRCFSCSAFHAPWLQSGFHEECFSDSLVHAHTATAKGTGSYNISAGVGDRPVASYNLEPLVQGSCRKVLADGSLLWALRRRPFTWDAWPQSLVSYRK